MTTHVLRELVDAGAVEAGLLNEGVPLAPRLEDSARTVSYPAVAVPGGFFGRSIRWTAAAADAGGSRRPAAWRRP